MKKVLVAGSSNTDLVISTSRIPAPGETILGGTFDVYQGGKGANQAVAAARAGAEVVFVARVGNDDMGEKALEAYAAEGIDTSQINRSQEVSTGVAVITVDETSGENSIIVAPGANGLLSGTDIDHVNFDGVGVLLAQLEIPMSTVQAVFERAAEHDIIKILNPAPAAEIPEELWMTTDIITPNESETNLLIGIYPDNSGATLRAAEKLLEKVNQAVVITMGEKGVFYMDKSGNSGHIPAPIVNAVDTTAAGDVFNGYLAAGLSMGLTLHDAIVRGIEAASLSVTRHGAQPSIPSVSEIS